MQIALILLAVAFTIFAAIRPFKIGKFPINIATSSILSLLLLVVFQVIDLSFIELGILGNGQLNPWEIIVIFFTVAYVSISLDVTGILDYIAYKIVHKAKGSGTKLFFFFYLFSCILTIFTSNDIVILTLTPIIFYLSKHADINITPLLFAEFFGANTLSTLLYIGNPTNIIIGNALNLDFVKYTEVMLVPTLVAAVLNIALLYIIFKDQITKKFKPKVSDRVLVKNWSSAIGGAVLVLCMLAALTLSSYLNIKIWQVTLAFSIVFVCKDLIFYLLDKIQSKSARTNYFWAALKRVPWRILPFVASFFIFVEGLNHYGLIDHLAQIAANFSTSLFSGIFVNGFVGLFLSNLINNQPATIFLSYILTSESFVVSKEVLKGSAYAVNISTSLAANITLIGALAGLMWQKILKDKGVEISYIDFLKKGLVITPFVFIISLISLYFVLV